MKYFSVILFCIVLFGCRSNSGSTSEFVGLDTIVVHVNKPIQKNVRDYFLQLQIIPLETNRQSVIHRIDRIIMDDNFLYILDQTRNAVLIFDKEGYFVKKIERTGRGPEEYISIRDFSLDRRSDRISVLTDRPQGMKKYDLNGRFVVGEDLPVLFHGIANYNGRDILINTDKQRRKNDNYYLWFKSDDGYEKRWPVGKTNHVYLQGPLTVESKHLYFTRRYDNVVMKIADEDAIPVYYLDFGNCWISDRDFAENEQDVNFFTFVSRENKICHSVSMIRETDNYLIFRTNLSGFFIHDKQTGITDYLMALQDDEIGFVNTNYFAHDGDDQKMLFTVSPGSLQIVSQLDGMEGSENRRRILDIASTIQEDSNPVLLLYTFK